MHDAHVTWGCRSQPLALQNRTLVSKVAAADVASNSAVVSFTAYCSQLAVLLGVACQPRALHSVHSSGHQRSLRLALLGASPKSVIANLYNLEDFTCVDFICLRACWLLKLRIPAALPGRRKYLTVFNSTTSGQLHLENVDQSMINNHPQIYTFCCGCTGLRQHAHSERWCACGTAPGYPRLLQYCYRG